MRLADAQACGGLLRTVRADDGAWLHPGLDGRPDGVSGGTKVAVNAVSMEHPRFVADTVELVDLTGEGSGDECGHGTVVALILLGACLGQAAGEREGRRVRRIFFGAHPRSAQVPP